jgi:hypothetical protein
VLIQVEPTLSDTCMWHTSLHKSLTTLPHPPKHLAKCSHTHPLPSQIHAVKNISNAMTIAVMKFTLFQPLLAFGTVSLLTGTATAGPVAYGICQAGCAAVVTACYSAGGATWGATLAATAPATILVCNAAFGKCSAACAVVALTPTP